MTSEAEHQRIAREGMYRSGFESDVSTAMHAWLKVKTKGSGVIRLLGALTIWLIPTSGWTETNPPAPLSRADSSTNPSSVNILRARDIIEKTLPPGALTEAQLGDSKAQIIERMYPQYQRAEMVRHDPNLDERIRRTAAVIDEEIAAATHDMEDVLRNGLAVTWANHFDADQLDQLAAFFTTTAGAKYEILSLRIWAEPAAAKATLPVLDRLNRDWPDVMRKIKLATADLPTPKATKK